MHRRGRSSFFTKRSSVLGRLSSTQSRSRKGRGRNGSAKDGRFLRQPSVTAEMRRRYRSLSCVKKAEMRRRHVLRLRLTGP